MFDPVEALNDEYRRAVREMPNALPPDWPQSGRRDGCQPITLTPGLLQACAEGARAGGTGVETAGVIRAKRTARNDPSAPPPRVDPFEPHPIPAEEP